MVSSILRATWSKSKARAKKLRAAKEMAVKVANFAAFKLKSALNFANSNITKDQKSLYLLKNNATGQTVKQLFILYK